MDLSLHSGRMKVMRSMTSGLLSALVAVSVASCGAGGGAGTRSDLNYASRGRARATLGLILAGDGIAGVKFGWSPAVVAASLGRRFGPPVGADQIAHGYIRAGCGFYWEVWDGLGASSDGRRFVAHLTAWFKRARFVGYSYGPNNFQTKLSTWSGYATHPMTLTTSTGLAVGDPLARGQRLYGQAFAVTTHPQGTPPDPRLIRLPVWEASTPSGPIEGGIGITDLAHRAHGTSKWTISHRSIVGIGAGVAPNTPCKR